MSNGRDHLTVALPPIRPAQGPGRGEPSPARASAADTALYQGALREINQLGAKLAIAVTALDDVRRAAGGPATSNRARQALAAIDAIQDAAHRVPR